MPNNGFNLYNRLYSQINPLRVGFVFCCGLMKAIRRQAVAHCLSDAKSLQRLFKIRIIFRVSDDWLNYREVLPNFIEEWKLPAELPANW